MAYQPVAAPKSTFFGWGKGGEARENFRGENCKNVREVSRNLVFFAILYAEIVKFGLILTHL